jgi:hypothetical protein
MHVIILVSINVGKYSNVSVIECCNLPGYRAVYSV